MLSGAGGWAYWLILIGIAVNAATTSHAWLTDAYPEASITGTIFLNSFTTKVAMYTLIRIFLVHYYYGWVQLWPSMVLFTPY